MPFGGCGRLLMGCSPNVIKWISHYPIRPLFGRQWTVSSHYSTTCQKYSSRNMVQQRSTVLDSGRLCPCSSIRKTVPRFFSSDSDLSKKEEDKENVAISDQYVPFQDRKRIIQDVIDQQWNPVPEWSEPPPVLSIPINLERGKTGVFDLDELIELVKAEHAEDLCVIEIPKEFNYTDHMVIVTARSPRHMFALATFIRKRFKTKHLKKTDVIPRIEGTKANQDWIALDLGNMVLHIFCSETREQFDLETLWTVGPQFDDLVNQKDSEIVQLLNLIYEPPPKE